VIEGRTILCFASGYDAPPTSKHHVMHILAERNTVLWVNYHASRVPTASSSDLLHMARKLAQVFAGLKMPRPNLHVLTPLVVPLPSTRWARRINRVLLLSQIRRALCKLRDGPLQIWSFTPDVAYALGHFGEEKVVYYCVDDHAAFSGYDRQQVLRDEEELCRKADLVVTTSMALQEAKKGWNPNTILVTHGVDYEHFSRAVREDLPCPPDIAGIPHPRLGFFGLIRDWVNLDLLAEVARKRPDWHIVMIGDADSTVDLAPYRALPNMHFLGRKPYADLPAYCRQFDVGLIPFKINELTKAVNPIKLREYLAAGLPVVSTPMPEALACAEEVGLVDSPEGFLRAVEQSLPRVAFAAKRAERAARMAGQTWAGKLRVIAQVLSDAPTMARRDASPEPGTGRTETPLRREDQPTWMT
jgi:glycosyltransferase involved in cell wall biosynthesis